MQKALETGSERLAADACGSTDGIVRQPYHLVWSSRSDLISVRNCFMSLYANDLFRLYVITKLNIYIWIMYVLTMLYSNIVYIILTNCTSYSSGFWCQLFIKVYNWHLNIWIFFRRNSNYFWKHQKGVIVATHAFTGTLFLMHTVFFFNFICM